MMITPADESIMSSFLMNSAGSYPGADPKFLSAEDYHSQASAASAAVSPGYMGHGDYYAHHAAAAANYPGGYPTTSMGLNNQHAASAVSGLGYSREQMAYGAYYQNCGISPHQQMLHQQMMAASAVTPASTGGHLSPLNHSAGSHLSGAARSPVSSPQPQSHPGGPGGLGNNLLNHHDGNGNSLCGNTGGNGGGSNGETEGYPSPGHPGIHQPQLTPGGGGGDGGMSSDCSDDESSPQSNRQMPVVYPWMKKIHTGKRHSAKIYNK